MTPVPWITGDDSAAVWKIIGQVTGTSTAFAASAKARALSLINSVDDGRIIVSPDPIPIWPPL